MKRSDFIKARGSNSPQLVLTPESCSNDGMSRLTFIGDDGKEYNFRGKNWDNAEKDGIVTEHGDDAYAVQRANLFQIDGWDAIRLSAPKRPDEVK